VSRAGAPEITAKGSLHASQRDTPRVKRQRTLFQQEVAELAVARFKFLGDILFMDNLSAHKTAGIDALIEACGAHLIYLPPYSPDFNPIEFAWSKVKTILRRLKARTFPDLIEVLKEALLAITPQEIQGWLVHCGCAST
jgi:transposase